MLLQLLSALTEPRAPEELGRHSIDNEEPSKSDGFWWFFFFFLLLFDFPVPKQFKETLLLN